MCVLLLLLKLLWYCVAIEDYYSKWQVLLIFSNDIIIDQCV